MVGLLALIGLLALEEAFGVWLVAFALALPWVPVTVTVAVLR